MRTLPDFLESGEIARLIPVIADSRREQRVASVFLSALSAIPDFAQILMGTLGVRLGKRAVIDTFTEVVLKGEQDAKDRPDGFILVTSGKKEWKALVEAKIGSASLDPEQVQRYLQIARSHSIDAVITMSNQFVARPMHSPITVPKTLTRRVGLFHWSWKMALTEALLLQTRKIIEDPDQVFLLREFIRFVSHDSIGIAGFDSMPPDWRHAVTLVKSGGTLRRSAPEAEQLISAWHQETRDLALRMSQHLATNVDIKLPRSHASDSEQRVKDDVAKLSSECRLEVEFTIPNTAASLMVVADLRTQTIRVGMQVDAPLDKQRGEARVNWLLRQLKSADEGNVFVRIVWPSRAQDTVCRLDKLRSDVKAVTSDAGLPPRSFEVFLLYDDARRFAGRRTFIEQIERAVPAFYDQVGQNLQRWVAKPPKPVKKDEPTAPPAEPQPVRHKPVSEQQQAPQTSVKPREAKLQPGNLHASLLDIPPFLRRTTSGSREN